MTSLVCKYTSNTVDAKTSPLKVVMISLVNFIVNTLNLILSKASNSSRYVYVK